ncbi:PREDICTED: Fanconi anemia-associated protein of 20 kDa-like [Galeopterus variegatus]|uniref:Fanconi anemia-associated protein of 20 kDa-like n=1 Tax=Galeopterus variegatus TaxID=482537 RepID=A0ABM0SI37_GALVR|nr:PREDICTED: Fanconi anemia-associated protein of 20 kDa-like [Galeopterus variegatus]
MPSPGAGRPWFLQEGGGECEHPWAALLRLVGADLTLDDEPLPAFPDQEPGRGQEPVAPPEVFTVGSKTFSWTPFPPAPGTLGSSYRLLCRAKGCPGSPAWSPEGLPMLDPCGTPSAKEQPSEEGAPALQSCPMCQKEFTPGLAQQDIDSHLAQCLAEGTEDVVW